MQFNPTKLIVKTLFGLESLLEQELIELGAQDTEIISRGVSCNYNLMLIYKINIESRLALRVIAIIEQFRATTTDELYDKCLDIAWENYLDKHQTFAIDNSIYSTYFKHSKFASLKLKDAICDRFRKIKNVRPNIDTENPDILFNLHINENHISIGLDASGDSLHKRGYKKHQDIAPINEVLAVGLIQLSNWDKESIFIDGMCGSGTIAIEAALLAKNEAPNLKRIAFACKKWNNFNSNLWKQCQQEAQQKIKPLVQPIIAIDRLNSITRKTEQNIYAAGLQQQLKLITTNFLKYIPPHQKGVCIINPPYGERMNTEDIGILYKQIGNSFKQHFALYTCGIITSNFDALKLLGLRPNKKYQLLNGKIDCKYYLYDIYA